MIKDAVLAWHRLVATRDPSGISAMLSDEIVFHSPVVFRPQRGRVAATRYLTAAFSILLDRSFRYVRETTAASEAMLEFKVEIDGISVNGVDMIKVDGAGKIVEFKVMIRPLQAINLVRRKMAAELESR